MECLSCECSSIFADKECTLCLMKIICPIIFRKELTRRLQSLMQQHIQEAVSLLSTENGSHTPGVVSSQVIMSCALPSS